MPKKIYDVRPPRVAKKVVNKIEKEKKIHTKPKKGRASAKKIFWICACLILVAVGVYLFFRLPKAEVIIWPKVDTLSFKQAIAADKSADLIDVVKAVIPAQYFQSAKTNAQDFPATGNAANEGYASGTITIYNKYDPPAPLTLRAGTHFMSDSGKLFVSFQKIVIPSAKKIGGKITPGSVQINIQAVEAGSDYNIAPSNFSIPGLKGTAYYYSVYAASTDDMAGGFIGKAKKVTADDIQGAKEVLTEKTISDALSDLKSQISSDYILLDSAVASDITNASTKTKAGAIADTFNYQVTVEASALVFKKSDLNEFAKRYILSQASDGKSLLEDSLKVEYSAGVIDASGEKITLNLDFSAGIYQSIDKNSIALSLLGENADQIRKTIGSALGDAASQVRVNFWPFWVFSAPNNQRAINIELKF